MEKTRPTAKDFKVGWISAVEVEFVAACELLDEEYPPLPSQPYDDNVYTFGRIGEHCIVLACLPKGEYGLSSAAIVATNMMRSFPIRFGLMVGIAGGAPTSKNDIRLGDIVVGVSSDMGPGVIYYNYGTAMQHGEFVRRGTLNAPPRILRNALQSLSMQHHRRGHRIRETISNMIDQNSRLEKKYQCPGFQHDVLFASSYPHQDRSRSCIEVCHDIHETVSRTARSIDNHDDPAIHYGLIASADYLMKDALRRDQLAEELNILCFEMEAAGLTNAFPCVVIRGVCDYSDSHKNDSWQGYAAATAAAYAKELLAVVPPEDVSDVTPTAAAYTQPTSATDQEPHLNDMQRRPSSLRAEPPRAVWYPPENDKTVHQLQWIKRNGQRVPLILSESSATHPGRSRSRPVLSDSPPWGPVQVTPPSISPSPSDSPPIVSHRARSQSPQKLTLPESMSTAPHPARSRKSHTETLVSYGESPSTVPQRTRSQTPPGLVPLGNVNHFVNNDRVNNQSGTQHIRGDLNFDGSTVNFGGDFKSHGDMYNNSSLCDALHFGSSQNRTGQRVRRTPGCPWCNDKSRSVPSTHYCAVVARPAK